MSARSTTRTLIDVDVDGGKMPVAHYKGPGQALVLLHGLSANNLTWRRVVDNLPDFDVYVPDMRGRAGSAELPGPYTFAQIVKDLDMMLEQLELACRGPITIAGHSMGALICVEWAATKPSFFQSLILVDSGIQVFVREGEEADKLVQAVFGPQMKKLVDVFPNKQAYLDASAKHPAFANTGETPVGPGTYMEEYWLSELADVEGGVCNRVCLEALLEAGRNMLHPDHGKKIGMVQSPMLMLAAERGMMNEEKPCLDEQQVLAVQASCPNLKFRRIPASNHFSLCLGINGSQAVAAAIIECASK